MDLMDSLPRFSLYDGGTSDRRRIASAVSVPTAAMAKHRRSDNRRMALQRRGFMVVMQYENNIHDIFRVSA